jgi:hypothetical protein
MPIVSPTFDRVNHRQLFLAQVGRPRVDGEFLPLIHWFVPMAYHHSRNLTTAARA